MPISGSQKALMEARSGVARSGATRSDYYRPYPIILINGTDRTAKTAKRTLRIENILNEQPDTATLTVFGFAPSAGQTIVVASGATSNRVFGGTILRRHQKSIRANAYQVYELECGDWTWTLNKRRAFKQYPAGTLANLAAVDLLTTYAPTFGTGKVKSGAPALTGDIAFRGTPLFDALQQLSQTVGWKAYPDYDPSVGVHFFDVETDQSPIALTTSNALYDGLDYNLEVSQIQTRVYGVGGGGQATSPVAVSATSIPTDECGWYSASGGKILAGSNLITYTGISTASGPGSITGVSGVSYAIKQGDTLNVFVQVDDAAAQTAMATIIGGGDDGIREGWIEDGRWSQGTVTAQATAQLTAFKSQDVRGSYMTYDKLTKAGKSLTITLASRSINTSVTIQRVVRRLAAPNKWAFDVDFSIVWSDLIDILARSVN